MTRIERDSDGAHPLPGRREGEAGGASLVTPCGGDERSEDVDRPMEPKPAAPLRIGRIFQEDVRSCVVSGDESGDESAGGEGGEG
jgi:hypothetical protein